MSCPFHITGWDKPGLDKQDILARLRPYAGKQLPSPNWEGPARWKEELARPITEAERDAWPGLRRAFRVFGQHMAACTTQRVLAPLAEPMPCVALDAPPPPSPPPLPATKRALYEGVPWPHVVDFSALQGWVEVLVFDQDGHPVLENGRWKTERLEGRVEALPEKTA